MFRAFTTPRASEKRKTYGNYRAAVPGIKSFFVFSEKFSARASMTQQALKRATDFREPQVEARKNMRGSREGKPGGGRVDASWGVDAPNQWNEASP